MNGLRGKVAFVTGAGSGTGRAVALSLARQGAHIAAFDRWEHDSSVESTVKLDRLKREVEQMGARCLTLCGDALKDIDVMLAVAEAMVEFRRIDILFNDAGAYPGSSPMRGADHGDISFERMWLAARHVIPRMLPRGEGTVITCAAARTTSQQLGWALYEAACPFEEIAHANIKIGAICPAASLETSRGLQQNGWTQLSQSREDLVTAVQELVADAFTIPSWQQPLSTPWRA